MYGFLILRLYFYILTKEEKILSVYFVLPGVDLWKLTQHLETEDHSLRVVPVEYLSRPEEHRSMLLYIISTYIMTRLYCDISAVTSFQ